MKKPLCFYFFNSRTAIRFHIARQLIARGWQETLQASEAAFGDQHLTLNDEISKNLEYKHLLARLVKKHCPQVMPLTYEINDENYAEVFARIRYENYLSPQTHKSPALKWILKPSMLNNGDHIHLFNNIDELKKHYSSAQRLGQEHVVQAYLTDPDLIDGRKYTFRIAAVLTNYAGVFLYQQGYVNISGYPFTLEDDFKNRKVHITNYVLDGEFANIEQRPTQSMQNFADVFAQMKAQVKCVIKGLLKEYPAYLAPSKHKIFEIFGFDFILDRNGKLWLLEINQGPDAPTFEENKLDEILWHVFWRDITEDFVLPIAQNTQPIRNYQNFTQILSAKACFSGWQKWIQQVKKLVRKG